MKTLCLLISTALLSTHAFAEANTYIRNGNIYSHQGQFFIEAGAVTGSELYKGQDNKTAIYVNGGYHGEDFNADITGINYRFFGDNRSAINFSAFIVPNIGYRAEDANILTGMKDRNISGDLGINADLRLGKGTLSAKFQHDVTGVYNGYQAGVTYYHPMNLGFADFVPFVGASYLGSDYVNYYTGVLTSEATTKRPAYKGSSTFVYKAGYSLVVPLSEHLDLTQSTGYSRLGSSIADSPLIESKNQWVASLGLTYSF
jgi:outer membrane protein